MNTQTVIGLTLIGAAVIVTLAAMSARKVNPAAVVLCGVLGGGFLWFLAIAIGANPKVSVSGASFDASPSVHIQAKAGE